VDKTTDDLKEADSISENYEQLFDEAHKEKASQEAKLQFAVNSVLLQNALKRHLVKAGRNDPDAYKDNPELYKCATKSIFTSKKS